MCMCMAAAVDVHVHGGSSSSRCKAAAVGWMGLRNRFELQQRSIWQDELRTCVICEDVHVCMCMAAACE